MKVFLVRHTRVKNPDGCCYGQSEPPLEDSYQHEAESIRCLLPANADRYYCSRLLRSQQLAKDLARSHPLERDERLDEICFGSWEGKSWDAIGAEALDAWAADIFNFRFPSGESYGELQDRVASFWSDLQHHKKRWSSVVIVTHAGVIKSLLSLHLGLSIEKALEFACDYGGITCLSLGEKGSVLHYVNRSFHSQSKDFSEPEKQGVYRAMGERRDMRHFSGGTVPKQVLMKIIRAGLSAPSVGLMQPWRFIRVTQADIRARISAHVQEERLKTSDAIQNIQGRGREFLRLKVEGLKDCAEILVVSMPGDRDACVFGRRTIPDLDFASVGCCIQNIWLAARAEGLGMGWVSLFEPSALRKILGIPPDALPVAILCLGPVREFYEGPMLESKGWDRRKRLSDVYCEDRWIFSENNGSGGKPQASPESSE